MPRCLTIVDGLTGAVLLTSMFEGDDFAIQGGRVIFPIQSNRFHPLRSKAFALCITVDQVTLDHAGQAVRSALKARPYTVAELAQEIGIVFAQSWPNRMNQNLDIASKIH